MTGTCFYSRVYPGFYYNDLQILKKTQLFRDIEYGYYIIGERDKNGNPTIIPLYKFPYASTIIEKYRDNNSDNELLFRKDVFIEIQAYNRNLKLLAKRANVNRPISNKTGQAILRVTKETFPNNAITSIRQQEIYNWLCSTAKANLLSDERQKIIVEFCLSLAGEKRSEVVKMLNTAGVSPNILFREQLALLEREQLHPEVYKHAKETFQYEKYAHTVLEVCKAYDKTVQAKTSISKFGRSFCRSIYNRLAG